MQQATPSWKWSTNIAALATITVPCGGENGTVVIVPTAGYKYLCFGYRFDTVVQLAIYVSVSSGGGIMLFGFLNGVAGNWMTPYNFPAPVGKDGFIVVTAPFINLRLSNLDAVNPTTAARFWAYLSN